MDNLSMSAAKIPLDISGQTAEEAGLAYWRGHMDAQMEDLSRRVGSIDAKVNNIHEVVQSIASDLKAKEATERQARGAIKWLLPDIGITAAIVLAVVAIVLRIIP